MLEENLLDPAHHDRKAFTSGVPALDEYLQRFAVQQSKKGISAVRVLVDSGRPNFILGYYSLSAAQVDALALGGRVQKSLPRYPVPCFRMGRLAVHADHQGHGIGRILMGCAIERCREARKQVAAYALIVDAKDERAKAFYGHYGFTAYPSAPLNLYLPLGND